MAALRWPPDRLARGELFRRVLAALGDAELTTGEIAQLSGCKVDGVGVALHRAAKRGLVVAVQHGVGQGAQNTWRATGPDYVPLPNGRRPDPTRPHSRYKPRTQAQVAMREAIYAATTNARAEKAEPPRHGPQTVDEFLARGGRIERLPGFEPVLPARMPVRQVYRSSAL